MKATPGEIIVLARMSKGWRLVKDERGTPARFWLEQTGYGSRREKPPDVPGLVARTLIDRGLVSESEHLGFFSRYMINRLGHGVVAAARQAGEPRPSGDPPTEGPRST